MTKRKTLNTLEALMDALEASKEVCAHNPVETEVIVNRIIKYQNQYIKISGRPYDSARKRNYT